MASMLVERLLMDIEMDRVTPVSYAKKSRVRMMPVLFAAVIMIAVVVVTGHR